MRQWSWRGPVWFPAPAEPTGSDRFRPVAVVARARARFRRRG
ncbi:hypothetical protein [Streptomyces sp. NPDC050704]